MYNSARIKRARDKHKNVSGLGNLAEGRLEGRKKSKTGRKWGIKEGKNREKRGGVSSVRETELPERWLKRRESEAPREV